MNKYLEMAERQICEVTGDASRSGLCHDASPCPCLPCNVAALLREAAELEAENKRLRTPPPGYRLVPVEPTQNAIAAGCEAFNKSTSEDGGVYFFSLKDMKAAYLAMLDAAEDSRE